MADSTLEPFHESHGVPVVLRATGLTKIYPAVTGKAGAEVVLFRELDLTIRSGEIVAIVGESGTGKSTLLHLLAALDRPTAGAIVCGDADVTRFTAAEAARYRNRDVGYVWQFHYLLPEFTAQENVAMPLLARGMGRPAALDRAAEWLGRVGLGGRLENRSGELSGGEQQRVSLARALVTEPRLLLADEPTGDLDNRTAETVFGLLEQLHRDHGLTSLLVTHNLEFANRCDRVLRLRNGSLEEASA
ncbi:lipoprotein-releasing system ATP-binding protein [Granulicella pectinivorans]|uniref:Lipoprotein-releasing system ATP-binding protein n=1 Tax=Granulicella pectinivorans TaxID=474950 RepID=A0A1I6MEZ0_9BACT|nr:ABC transporter ATP-binding protein [Granulicella pectinivorans]SFS14192.1 lipoprotein-releasing system ATP-binding protein [Granulicella pectinivorans]